MIIKTWQDRLKGGFGHNDATTVSAAMQAEINELRAALAAKLVPMTEDKIIELCQAECEHFRWPSSAINIARAVEAHHSQRLAGG